MLHRILVGIIAFAWICPLLCAVPAYARMEMIGEDELAKITAQSGISIYMDATIGITVGNIKISDTSAPHNWIELQGFSIGDGAGGPFYISTPLDSPITFDVGTLPSGKTMFVISDSSQTQPRFYSAQSIVFVGQDIGSLRIGPVTMGPSTLAIAGHSAGVGIDAEYVTKLDIGSFLYTYNTQPSSLNLSGIHLAGSAAGDPTDPASWVMSGNFKVGDIVNDPATFDIGTSTTTGNTSLFLNLPMQGSLRIEDVKFGAADFGPIAIDGINVHRLGVKFTP